MVRGAQLSGRNVGQISGVQEHTTAASALFTFRDCATRGKLRAAGAAGCVVLGDLASYGRFGLRREPALVLQGVP